MKSVSLPCTSHSSPGGVRSFPSPILVELAIQQSSANEVFRSVVENHPGFRIQSTFDQTIPRMTILEVDPDPYRALATIQSLQSVRPARDIFLAGAPPDSAVLHAALRAGVKEFFSYPVDPQAVSIALRRYAESFVSSESKDSAKAGQIVSVLGSSGGLGVTSLAVNLAVSLKTQEPEKSVVLVEIDQQSGNLPVYLDLSPLYSFQDINRDFPRLDDTLVKKFLTDHESGIQILPSGYDNLHPGSLDAFGAKQTIMLLASLFDYIVVDVGHILEDSTINALSLSDHILLVTTFQVPVIHRTQALLQALEQQDIEGHVELVATRYRSEEDELMEETESVLQHRVNWRIPENGIPARQAINQGAPCVLSHPKSPIAKSYAGLAGWVSGQSSTVPDNRKLIGNFQKLIQFGRAKLHLAQAS